MYDRRTVENLLPTIWDESYAFGLDRDEHAPDPDMPRGSRDVSHGNTLYAYLADMKTAWKHAPMTLRQRRAVFLRHAFGLTEVAIGAHENVSQQAISRRLEGAVGRMTNYLNGDVQVSADDDDESEVL